MRRLKSFVREGRDAGEHFTTLDAYMREVTIRETLAYSAAATFCIAGPNASDLDASQDRNICLRRPSKPFCVAMAKELRRCLPLEVRQYESTEVTTHLVH